MDNTLTTSSFFFENKSETTKQALRDLNEQLKHKLNSDQNNSQPLIHHHKRRRSESEDDDDDDDEEYENGEDCEKKKKKSQKKPQLLSKIDVTTFVKMTQTIEKLKNTKRKQSEELDKFDISLYQTKLELSNTTIDLSKEKEKNEKLAKENKGLVERLKFSTFSFYASWVFYFMLQCFFSGNSVWDWLTSPWEIVVIIIIALDYHCSHRIIRVHDKTK